MKLCKIQITVIISIEKYVFFSEGKLEDVLDHTLVELIVEKRVGIFLPCHCFHREEGFFFDRFS